jgi:uncharacterized membrane protein YuzA (DUF378 family)
MSLVAAVLAGVAGFMAFNVFDTVFGVTKAVVGLMLWIALTAFVFRRPARPEEESDA